MTSEIQIVLSGGLGNQLFQLSAGTYLENFLGKEVLYDISNLAGKLVNKPGNYTRNLEVSELIEPAKIRISKIPIRIRLIKDLLEKNIYRESFLFENGPSDDLVSRVTKETKRISGFFQNSELVDKTWLEFAKKLAKSNLFSKFVDLQPINRVAMHLRFGDYSDDPKTKSFYGLTKTSYYVSAYEEIIKKNSNKLEIIVVTDNVEKAIKTINQENCNTSIFYISNKSAIDDLFEISRSSHVVMSNSTFSWWGAWFAYKGHEAKIVYPRPWFADNSDPDLPIFFDSWIAKKREFSV